MWTAEWPVDELRRVDRKVRSIINECSGRYPREENLYHVMCNCPGLAQDLYKSRHDGLLIHLHRAILDKNGIPPDNSKFSEPEPCIEKENV